jgi:hypothetical protein
MIHKEDKKMKVLMISCFVCFEFTNSRGFLPTLSMRAAPTPVITICDNKKHD